MDKNDNSTKTNDFVNKDSADYEHSEEQAITQGKEVLKKNPWLFNRRIDKTKGFFCETRENDTVHPKYYSVHCTDGAGTKVFLAPYAKDFTKTGIDGVMMNANDLATIIHAMPDSVNIYFAMQTQTEREYMGQIMHGICEGLKKCNLSDIEVIPNIKIPYNINMGKMETASLDEVISCGVKNLGWDLGIVMSGFIEKSKMPNLNPKPGHIIVGVSSSGLHSNGYTGARHALFKQDESIEFREHWRNQYRGKYLPFDKPETLEGKTILEALMVPTADYIKEAATIGQLFDNRDIYGINITGNGLANFNRAGENVAFEITHPLPMLPIHKLLMQESGWDPHTSYLKQNNGMGFAYIVPSIDIAEKVVALINKIGNNKAQIVGSVIKCDENYLSTTIKNHGLSNEPLTYKGYTN